MLCGVDRPKPEGSVSADLVFVNGAVYTVDAARRWAEAVAVGEGAITAVGTDTEIRELIGPSTEVIELEGRMVVPGFQDAHVHPIGSGVDLLQCDLHHLRTPEEYVRAIRAYADAHPEREWILGGGWALAAFPGGTPTKEALDAVVSDHPIFLPNADGHGAWVNSAALKIAGITRDTPDPVDGRIERDAQGEPSGTLHEGAMQLVADHTPAPTDADLDEGLLKAQ